jgi:hypothetical protein
VPPATGMARGNDQVAINFRRRALPPDPKPRCLFHRGGWPRRSDVRFLAWARCLRFCVFLRARFFCTSGPRVPPGNAQLHFAPDTPKRGAAFAVAERAPTRGQPMPFAGIQLRQSFGSKCDQICKHVIGSARNGEKCLVFSQWTELFRIMAVSSLLSCIALSPQLIDPWRRIHCATLFYLSPRGAVCVVWCHATAGGTSGQRDWLHKFRCARKERPCAIFDRPEDQRIPAQRAEGGGRPHPDCCDACLPRGAVAQPR